jgi:hypothetical protein
MPGPDTDPMPDLGLRLATWNIHAGVGTDGGYSPQRVAGIAGPTLLKEGCHYGNALLSRPRARGQVRCMTIDTALFGSIW